jgi:hypothetical protein
VGCFLSFITQKQETHGTQSMGFEDWTAHKQNALKPTFFIERRM